MIKEYVLPVPKDLRNKLLEYNRLYAYPTVPELEQINKFIILDSGAFGLSKLNKEIDKAYMFRLNQHYLKFGASDKFPIIAVAPDVFLNPIKTIENFEYWQKKGYCRVSPVLQASENKKLDYNLFKFQVDFYKKYSNDFILFSNPSMTAIDMINQDVERIFTYIKDSGFKWIHILGAGWFPTDIRNYNRIKNFDSLDTIAYYTSAQQEKESWDKSLKSDDWIEKSLKNAKYGNYLINELLNNILGKHYV